MDNQSVGISEDIMVIAKKLAILVDEMDHDRADAKNTERKIEKNRHKS